LLKNSRSVHILIFDEVEVLDFAGPFEVFAVAGRRDGLSPFDVSVVSHRREAITARGGLSINPKYGFGDCPDTDILLIPGGRGTRVVINDRAVIDWVIAKAASAELVLSVCSGALVLGRAGLLNGVSATTHYSAMDELRLSAPMATVHENARVVDNGHVILSAGVAAGIDLSLHVVQKLFGSAMADETANYIEYNRNNLGALNKEVAA
jgi:Transcriptional regulator containing an amidase domain and an AraC-type DNA-binding HTH domain